MAVRTRYKIEVTVSSTPDEEKDLGHPTWEVWSDTMGEGGIKKVALAPAAPDTLVPLDLIASCKFLAIRTNAVNPNDLPGTVNVKLNSSGGTAIPVSPIPDAKEGHLLLSTSGITALYVANPGTVAMNVTVAAAGD